MPEPTGVEEKQNHEFNAHDSSQGPLPKSSDEWLVYAVRAIRQQIQEIREEIGRVRSLREKDEDQLLTYEDVAKRLKVSKRHVQTLAHSGELQPICIGRAVRFHPDAVDAFIEKAEVGER